MKLKLSKNNKCQFFVYYNYLRTSKWLNLTETNQYLIYDNHKVILFFFIDPNLLSPLFPKLRGKSKKNIKFNLFM